MTLADALRAIKAEKAGRARETMNRAELDVVRHERAAAIVRHAARHSRHYKGIEDLRDVEPLGKAALMAHYDEIVTDPRLRRDDLLAHVESLDRDALYLDRYRVIATSGSSGLKGLYTYDRPDWAALCGGFLRATRMAGNTPRLPRRSLVVVGPAGGGHMSRRMASTMDIGLHRTTALPVTLPLDELLAAVQRARPDTLAGFPTMLAVLAREQLAGRLDVRPSIVVTSSELRTEDMTQAMRDAWGIEPFDVYGITEAGILGVDCEHHRGIHVFEDMMEVEVADRDGNPLPDGETGAQILVTSFENHVQPTLRVAISDMVAFDPEPCPCGRPFRLLRAVEGRTDDVVHLKNAEGRRVPVHPLQFAPVAAAREVREFQIVQEGAALRVRVALNDGASAETLEPRLIATLGDRLRALGVADPDIRVEVCAALERDPARMGKLKLVVAEPV